MRNNSFDVSASASLNQTLVSTETRSSLLIPIEIQHAVLFSLSLSICVASGITKSVRRIVS